MAVEKVEAEVVEGREEEKKSAEPSKAGEPPSKKQRAGAATRRRQRGQRVTSASMRPDCAECLVTCCIGSCVTIFLGGR